MTCEPLPGSSRYSPSTGWLGGTRCAPPPAASMTELRATREPLSTLGRSGFQKLFEVAIEHEYHAGLDPRCLDFTVHPNARTTRLMRSLGLVFRDDGASFSVLHDAERFDDLAAFLAKNVSVRGPSAPPEPWTYLSFFLSARSGRVATFTDIDPALNPLSWNFFLRSSDFIEPAIGAAAVARRAIVPLPIRPARFAVEGIPEGGMAVIRNAPGVEIKTIDRARPGELGPPFYMDLSRSFEGYYTLDVMDEAERARHLAGARPPGGAGFIYTLAAPAPLFFLHILLNRPTAGLEGEGEKEEEGLYPVTLGSPRPPTSSVRYLIRLGARRTRWVYHVIPRGGESAFTALRVEATAAAEGEALPVFAGPVPTREPNGAAALLFTSEGELPIVRRSPYRLRLRGRARGTEERVLVEPLPVAAADTGLRRYPEDALHPRSYASHIYVYV